MGTMSLCLESIQELGQLSRLKGKGVIVDRRFEGHERSCLAGGIFLAKSHYVGGHQFNAGANKQTLRGVMGNSWVSQK